MGVANGDESSSAGGAGVIVEEVLAAGAGPAGITAVTQRGAIVNLSFAFPDDSPIDDDSRSNSEGAP